MRGQLKTSRSIKEAHKKFGTYIDDELDKVRRIELACSEIWEEVVEESST